MYAKIPSIDVVCKFVADGNMDVVRTAITSIIHEADNPQGLFILFSRFNLSFVDITSSLL